MLKSSNYYKMYRQKLGIRFALSFLAMIVTTAGAGFLTRTIKSNAERKVMQPTGYYEYVEENTAIYDKMLENEEISQEEYENHIAELNNPETYLDQIGDENSKGLLKQYNALSYLTLLIPAPFMVLSVISPILILRNDLLTDRAEKIEAMRAETDSIKVNYDPKHSNDDYDINVI